MGKYPKSTLNDKYSDWHWEDKRFIGNDHLSDVDRIWVEVRSAEPIAAFDIKGTGDTVTWTEEKVYNWLENKGLPVYIVNTDIDFKEFEIGRWKTNERRNFNQEQYIEWINDLANSIF